MAAAVVELNALANAVGPSTQDQDLQTGQQEKQVGQGREGGQQGGAARRGTVQAGTSTPAPCPASRPSAPPAAAAAVAAPTFLLVVDSHSHSPS